MVDKKAPSLRGGFCGPMVARAAEGNGLLAFLERDDDPEDKVGYQSGQAARKE
jgi:hypothetical protein